MKHVLTTVAASILASVAPSSAQDELTRPAPVRPPVPIVIKNSLSPNGRVEITITDTDPDENSGMAMGVARIVDVETHRALGFFNWSGFGYHPDTEAFDVLWRPDSGAFTVATEVTRGYKRFEAYVLSKSGHCHRVAIPDYITTILKKQDFQTHSHGHNIPLKWLPDSRLLLSVGNRAWEEDYTVIVRVPRRISSAPLKAALESISLER